MAEEDLDKSESATPYKLEKAREKGQVARSVEFTGVGVFAAAIIYLLWRGLETVNAQFRMSRSIFLHINSVTDPLDILALLTHVLEETLLLLLPFMLVLLIASVLLGMLQIGPNLSFEPLKADFDRLNPVHGFKKIFNLRTVFETTKALIKLVLIGVVAFFALRALAPQFLYLSQLPAYGYLKTMLDDIGALGVKIALIAGFLALLDLLYTRYEFAKKMRMSMRELKDEHKHREGDPRIRNRLRELRLELFKKTIAIRKTPNASVLITNPTHFAVALKYEHGEMPAPQVLAKGSGDLAILMRKIATRHSIPIVQNPRLARELYFQLQEDQYLPEHLYARMAKIFVWLMAMRQEM